MPNFKRNLLINLDNQNCNFAFEVLDVYAGDRTESFGGGRELSDKDRDDRPEVWSLVLADSAGGWG